MSRYRVLESLLEAAARLQQEDIRGLIPETMSNLAYAAPYAEGPQDVAAFPARLVKSPQGLLIPAPPVFGTSRRLAAVILAVLENHPRLRAAMNIKVVAGLEEIAPLLAFKMLALGGPGESLKGDSGEWEGLIAKVAAALKPGEPPPDLLHDPGDWGREPRLYILGTDPQTVAEKVVALKNALSAAGKLAG
jgi:predicted fused transcriptional regulator/phosphomethylpyrimidine kinase